MLPIHSAYCACIDRSSPRSWRSAASVGAYAWPSTMRVATSPGMRRSSRNTITLTRKSVGTARATRRSTYCFIGLLVEPGEEQSHAEAVPVVVPETLHVIRMRDVLRPLRHVDVVGLVGEVALDVIHDLLALLGIHLAALGRHVLAVLLRLQLDGDADLAQV